MPGKLDIKKIRQDAGMTQKQFANRLNIAQSQVSKMENGSKIDSDLLLRIADALMMSPNELMNYTRESSPPFTVNGKREELLAYLRQLKDYVDAAPEDFTDMYVSSLVQALRGMMDNINALNNPPRIAFIGRFSVGKSTMISTMLGQQLDGYWRGVDASLCLYIRHCSERPAYMGNDDVWIFRRDENGAVWDDGMLPDELKSRRLLLASGGQELLRQYGQRQNMDEAASAVLFMDADLLKSCSLIDTPGICNPVSQNPQGLDDHPLQVFGLAYADIVLYLLSSTNTLSGFEASVLQVLLSERKKNRFRIMPDDFLRTFYIVSVRADLVQPDELKEKMDSDLKCCVDTFLKGIEVTEEALKERCFTYSASDKTLCMAMEEDLRELLEEWPKQLLEGIDLVLDRFITSQRESIKQYVRQTRREMEEERENRERRLKETERYSLQVWDRVKQDVEILCRQSQDECHMVYQELIQVDTVARLLRERFHSGVKKQDLQNLYTWMMTRLNSQTEAVMKKYTENVWQLVCMAAEEIPWLQQAAGISQDDLPPADIPRFVANQEMMPEVLSSIPMGTVGLAANMLMLPTSVFVPAILGIGIGLETALQGIKVTSPGREKWQAAKFVKACEDSGLWEKCQEQLSRYWDMVRHHIERYVEQASEKLHTRCREFLELEHVTEADRAASLARMENELASYVEFLSGIPRPFPDPPRIRKDNFTGESF